MKKLCLALILIVSLYFSACSSDTTANVRSIYMLLNPSTKSINDTKSMQKTFAYIINDLSPGDSLAIQTPHEVLAINFSEDASKAYVQKRDFRRKVLAYIKNFKPELQAKLLPTLAKAKAYLETKIAYHKSIIYCNPAQDIPIQTQDLEGYTVSLVNFSQQATNLVQLKNEIEMANGRFLVASNVKELAHALSFK